VRIDVRFNGSAAGHNDLHDRVVLVVDVLRASTTIAAALANGARAVIPFEGVDEAIIRARSLERSDVLLAGERKMAPIPGFTLGNSPREFTPDVVTGKTIVMTTTNGTAALAGASHAPEVLVVSACSGHGFKFCSVVGEIVADLVTDGRSNHDLSLFRLDRFQG